MKSSDPPKTCRPSVENETVQTGLSGETIEEAWQCEGLRIGAEVGVAYTIESGWVWHICIESGCGIYV